MRSTKKSFVIVPGCSDLNRGDQALVWETKNIAIDSGFDGTCSLISESNEPTTQSKEQNINIILPVLQHPSRKFKGENNIVYTKSLKIKWGIVAFFDLIYSILLLNKVTRGIVYLFCSSDVKESIDTFNNSDAIFMKGGGIVHAYGGFTATYTTYFSLYHIILGICMKKEVYIMPNSFGPYEGPFVKTIVKWVFNKVNFISARESLTQEMAFKELGIHMPNYVDLAFNLANKEMDKDIFWRKYNIPNGKKIVAFTMRPHRFPKSVDPLKMYNKYVDSLVKTIKWLNSKDYFCVLIEHTLAINPHENDRDCIDDVANKLEGTACIISERDLNCHGLKTIYGYFDYIIATRFHSLIFSMANGVPGIAITYAGNKAQGIMLDMGLENLAVSIDDVSDKHLKEMFDWLIANENEVVNKIVKYRQKSKETRDNIVNIIKKRNS